MSVKYIPPSKNVGESVHDINDNFETLDKQNEAIARTVAGKADTADVRNLAEQLNNKANTSDLDSKADKTSLASKVDNDQTGATELIDALGESNATPGTEDSFIVKSLNQYTRRPFTALLNWIKSNLAKVATSGSYNDLTNKPDIPTVDSSFSESGTNAVAGNVILSALNSKANKTELQALSNQVSNKADADHTHAYLPLAGGTMDDDSTIKLPYSNGRTATVKSNGIEFTMPTTNEGWASGLMFSKKDGTTRVGNIGAYGGNNTLEYYFIGPVYNNPLIKILPTGQTTIKSSTDPLILKRSVAGASSIKFENSNGALGWIGFDVLNESIKRWDGAGTHEYAVLDTGNAFTTTVPKANGTASAGTANTVSRSDHVHPPQKNAETWNGLTDDTMTANTTDTRLMVLNGNKVQHRQIDTLPFLSSKDLSQSVLFTSTTNTTSATITGLFANYSLVWFQVVGSKTTHTHILPLAYLKSKGSLTFKDSGTPINILYVSDTQIRWFEYQGQGAETYTSVTIVKII